MLKKAIAIFLLLQFVSNNTFAEELIKIPRLFTHFYHHAYEHKDIKSFPDFLQKHYSEHHKTDSHSKGHDGEDNDCQLPFKHCGGCNVTMHAPVFGFVSPAGYAGCNIAVCSASSFFGGNDRIVSRELCPIWQPPKLAWIISVRTVNNGTNRFSQFPV